MHSLTPPESAKVKLRYIAMHDAEATCKTCYVRREESVGCGFPKYRVGSRKAPGANIPGIR